jgi:hypothetical protein
MEWKNIPPKEKSTSFAPTATTEPLEDPPVTQSSALGFQGVPYIVYILPIYTSNAE